VIIGNYPIHKLCYPGLVVSVETFLAQIVKVSVTVSNSHLVALLVSIAEFLFSRFWIALRL